MTEYDKKVWFWLSISLLISLALMMGFALGETAWVAHVKQSIFQLLN